MVASQTGSALAEALQGKVGDLEQALAGVTEEEASRPIDGDWTIRHVLSHLLGAEDSSLAGRLRGFIDEDMPSVDVRVGDPIFAGARQQMSYAQLLEAVRQQYAGMASFLNGCTQEQFERRGRLPAYFKDSPITDTPTLAQWSAGLIHFHLADHIAQIRAHR